MRFILLLLLTVSSLAFGQRSQTIDADCLRIKDGTCIDKLELGYLDGASANIQVQINDAATALNNVDNTSDLNKPVSTAQQSALDLKADDNAVIHLTGDESVAGVKTFTGKITASSTTNGFKPCPEMTEAQRDAVVTPVSGDCVFNSTSATLNIYNGSLWKSAGGGLSDWAGSFAYALGDVVIADDKIYQCNEAHTSFDFATDLAAVKWIEISPGLTGIISLANGGTAKNITASNGAIAYSDTDSLELLAPGTSGQILQANGVAAPTFVNKSISAKAENGSSVTLEEIQAPNNQLTTTATNKHLLNDCGSSNNLLANCGFEHSTPATSWTLTNGSSAVETSNVKQGKQALKLTLSAQALDFYQTSTLNVTALADGVNGSISLAIKTTVDNVYLCRTDSAGAVVASTDGTKITNCVKISNSGKWGDYVLPVILGATSNGLRLVSLTPSTAAAVAVTGDVYVDAGILEAGLKVASVSSARKIGSVKFSGCSTVFSSASTSYASMGTNSGCTITTTGEVSAPVTQVLGFRILGRQVGTYEFRATGQFGKNISTTNSTLGFVFRDTTSSVNSINENIVEGSTSSGITITVPVISGDFNYTTSGDTSYEVFAKTSTTTSSTLAYANNANPTVIDVYFYPSSNTNTFSIPSDSFSTDSNTLTWSASAITASSPIGTYNTYSYAINSNTKSLCTGTSDPDILPNAADGFKIFTRAYNAASTCGNPARVEIKIGAAGTKFPTIKTDIYKSAAKATSGEVDFAIVASSDTRGINLKSYDESTGVLIIDSGLNPLTTTTTWSYNFSDITVQSSGFLVINAQKAKDSIIGSFAEVNTSPGIAKPKTCHYAFGGASATLAVPTECTTGTCVEVYDSCGTGTPPAYNATAIYTDLTFASGTFSSSSYIDCECKAWDSTNADGKACVMYFATSDNTWSTNSSGGLVLNAITTSETGVSETAYVQFTCKGSAP